MRNIKIIIGLIILLSAPFLLSFFGKIAAADGTKPAALTRVSAPDADSAEPNMAAAPGGGVYLVWVEHAGGDADVFLQKFDTGKNPVGEKTRVNPQAGKATAWRGDPPSVVVGANKTVYIGWTARVETDEGTANDLYLSVSRDGGKSFNAPVKVNDDTLPAVHGMHALMVDKNNNIYFSWLDERYLKHENHEHHKKTEDKTDAAQTQPHHKMEMNREVYFTVSKDGGKTFAANKKLAGDACPCCKTSIIAAPDGRIYVSWRQVLPNNYRHIAVASSSDGGKTFAAPMIVSDDKWQIEGCPVSGAALAVGANNTLKVVWYSAGEAGKTGLYWAESKDGGATFSPRRLLYEGVLTGTPVLLAEDENKDYKIVWQSNGKVWQLSTQLTQNDGVKDSKIEEIGTGKMPSATIADEKLYVGLIQNEGDKRSIWLY